MTYIEWISLIEKLETPMVALLGALVGGFFAIKGVYIAHDIQEKNELRNFLRAIHSEVLTIWERYEKTYKINIDKLGDGKFLEQEYPLKQDYFTVYNNNTHFLGKIKDSELRSEIIITYIQAKGLIDSLLSNNESLDKYNKICWILSQENTSANQGAKLAFEKVLFDYAPKIKEQSLELEQHVNKLVKKLDGYSS